MLGRFKNADPEAVALMLEALEENCLALRRLDVFSMPQPDIARAFIERTHGRLHHLETRVVDIHGFSPAEYHCTGLQSLILEDLPRNLRGLLRVVGPTLESIHFDEITTREMGLI